MSVQTVVDASVEPYLEEARALLADDVIHHVSGSLYDTAWVARTRRPGSADPAFPHLLEILRRGQAPDDGKACEELGNYSASTDEECAVSDNASNLIEQIAMPAQRSVIGDVRRDVVGLFGCNPTFAVSGEIGIVAVS